MYGLVGVISLCSFLVMHISAMMEEQRFDIKSDVRLAKVETRVVYRQGGILACAIVCRSDSKCGGFTLLRNGECLVSKESVNLKDNLESFVDALTGTRALGVQDPNPPEVITGVWCDPSKGGKVYPAHLNSDKRLDLICRNLSTGMLEFAVSVAEGSKTVFKTAGKQKYPHCPSGNQHQVLVADMNKDGIYDIYCNDETLKKKVFTFFGSNLEITAAWVWDDGIGYCPSPLYKLYIGVFDSSGKTQLFCHRISNGAYWSRYVQDTPSVNHITGTFCKEVANGYTRFWTHDVNNDNYTDLICMQEISGRKSVVARLATAAGKFKTQQANLTDLYGCLYKESTIVQFVYINDGDRFYDITCHNLYFNYNNRGTINPIQSDMKFYLSSGVSGVFPFGKITYSTNRIRLCSDDKGHMHLGDFFGNGRFQFLCHGKNGLELKDSPYKP